MTEQPARQIAVVMRDPGDLHRALRERAEQLDISREAIDELAGLPKGYAAKLLCEPPMRQVGPTSLFPIAGALAYAIAFVVDDTRLAIATRLGKRKPGCPSSKNWRNARKLSIAQDLARKRGKMGADAYMKKVSPKRRSQIARKAAKARWRKPKIVEITPPIKLKTARGSGA